MIILMDYLNCCEELGIRCELDWRPHETNVEADEITNENFTSFDPKRRIFLEWENISLPMVELLMSSSEAFAKRKHETEVEGAVIDQTKFQKTTWG